MRASGFNIIAISFLLGGHLAFASGFKVPKDKLKLFDQSVVQHEEETCKVKIADEKSFREWLLSEAKIFSKLEPSVGTSNQKVWVADEISLKVGDDVIDAKWEPHSPGSFGKINGAKIQSATEKDGKTLKAPLADVGGGTLSDLADRKDLDGKIWLVEQSPLIPSLVALSLEAKLHKALGLVVFGQNKANLDADGAQVLPILRIENDEAKKLKEKIKAKETVAEMTVRTEFPVTKAENWIYVKQGSRDLNIGVFSDIKDCKSVSLLLGVIDWVTKADMSPEGTVYEFATHPNADSQQGTGQIASEIMIDPENFSSEKFLNQWMKIDRDLSDVIDGKKVLKGALVVAGNLQGLIDKEQLNEFKVQLKQLETIVKAKPEVAWRLKQLFQNDSISEMASNLKSLRQVHDYAQRGQWEKAVGQFQKIHSFEWATNVSPATFMEYEKENQSEESVNPLLWTELQKGRGHLDGFVNAVEVEIDRLDQRLSDNFFKLHKSIENLDKI